MRKIEVEIDGRKYPCYQTMGALLDFKRETGREATEIKSDALSDMVTLIWCCVRSASRREGVEFGLTLEGFADRMTLEDVMAWAAALDEASGGADSGEKKTERAPQ